MKVPEMWKRGKAAKFMETVKEKPDGGTETSLAGPKFNSNFSNKLSYSKPEANQGGHPPGGGEVPGRLQHTLWGGGQVQGGEIQDLPCEIQRGAPVLRASQPDQLRGGDSTITSQSTAAESASPRSRQVSANGGLGESVQWGKTGFIQRRDSTPSQP